MLHLSHPQDICYGKLLMLCIINVFLNSYEQAKDIARQELCGDLSENP